MTRANLFALLLSLLGFLTSAWVTERVFERIPHIEDEFAYTWQAKLISAGQLKIDSPPHPKSYLVPFVVDYNGERFGKYPPGWPVVLALGVRLGLREWVNPLLAGLAVWLIYRLGRKVFGAPVGLLAAALTVSSPFYMLNSGSLLSHPLGLVLSTGFTLGWLNAFSSTPARRPGLWAGISALFLGGLSLTRPLTAVAVGLPFAAHGLFLLLRGKAAIRWRLLLFGSIILGFVGLYFAWQFYLTGNPFLNPYTLWWPYDQIGFGPGHGHAPEGHTLSKAYYNTKFSLQVGMYDLFGWSSYSWIFLPFGLWVVRRNRAGLLVGSIIFSLVLVYTTYWIGSWLYGPRYYYEGLYSLTLLSAAGIAWLAGWPVHPGEAFRTYQDRRKLRPLVVTAVAGFLVAFNLVFYTPIRLGSMYDLYGISRSDQAPFLTPEAQSYTPALIIVHSDRWMGYGAFLDLQDPFLSTPFIFAWSNSVKIDVQLTSDFPRRAVFHYYLDSPYVFYTAERSSP